MLDDDDDDMKRGIKLNQSEILRLEKCILFSFFLFTDFFSMVMTVNRSFIAHDFFISHSIKLDQNVVTKLLSVCEFVFFFYQNVNNPVLQKKNVGFLHNNQIYAASVPFSKRKKMFVQLK